LFQRKSESWKSIFQEIRQQDCPSSDYIAERPHQPIAIAIAVAVAFLVVIPEGDLLLSLSFAGPGPKIYLKKRKFLGSEKVSVNTPRFTINPPQTHHDLTIKKHHKIAKPPAKTHLHHKKHFS
jgi:hypothetical protein